MKNKAQKEKIKCPHCGNNPVNHPITHFMQTFSVSITPLIKVISVIENQYTFALVKILFTPYFYFFRGIGMLRFSNDSNKAVTERSEVIWEEAKKRDIEMEQFIIFGKPVEHYRAKINGSWQYFYSLPIPPHLHSRSYSWMDDKKLLKKKFLESNIKTPKGGSATTWKKALEIFEKIQKPVIVKPQVGSRGRHTTTNINTVEELRRAYNIAKKLCHFVVIEEHLTGSVYRGTYVGNKVVGILQGDPPRITGNGEKSIRELIREKNKTKDSRVQDVTIDQKLEYFLERQAYTLESILPKGKTIDLSEKIGISYGGFAEEITEKTHPKIIEELKKAGDLLKAPVVGFDFIIEDPTLDPGSSNSNWGIIEANSLPFINLHHFPLEGTPVNVAAKIWDLWK